MHWSLFIATTGAQVAFRKRRRRPARLSLHTRTLRFCFYLSAYPPSNAFNEMKKSFLLRNYKLLAPKSIIVYTVKYNEGFQSSGLLSLRHSDVCTCCCFCCDISWSIVKPTRLLGRCYRAWSYGNINKKGEKLFNWGKRTGNLSLQSRLYDQALWWACSV